jgi:hypothetical protein
MVAPREGAATGLGDLAITRFPQLGPAIVG